MVSELAESSLEEGTRSPPLNVSSISAVGAITIESKVAQRARTLKVTEAILSSPIDKRKKVVENLSSTPDNELLNGTEVNVESTLASMAEMLCDKIFKVALDVSDPHSLALISHLVYATKQQAAFSLHPIEALGDSLREMLLMSFGMYMDIDVRNRSL
ncbi:uncharacterized protein LOC110619837 [Manihot esculenta]|uniref:uncharacterized protein LOC110619837 n=1 Tax=Manihot esculenta TaxID=3983 RepID=UPI000B5D6CD3|nr:uncharacterized protein LOC110619837 [Manihot esculenta]